MRIGELAQASGLSRDALRFYERQGLLKARRRDNGYRDYPVSSVAWLHQLKLAQQLGFTLAELKAALPLMDGAAGALDREVARLLADKLSEVDQRLAQMQQLRDHIAQRVQARCPLKATAP